MQLHHGQNMLTDNSQSLLYGGSRISLRARSLFVSGFLYVINSAPAHWQTSLAVFTQVTQLTWNFEPMLD